jgi:hypothetical protein
MNNISCFYSSLSKGYGYFGPYPNQLEANILVKSGISLFVDLTLPHEDTSSYRIDCRKISFPIPDRGTPPLSSAFYKLIALIKEHIRYKQKVYIHCRGGHGRSGMVAACVLAYIIQIRPEEAIKQITTSHQQRPTLRQFWKDKPCPNSFHQRQFIFNACKDTSIDSMFDELFKKVVMDLNEKVSIVGLENIILYTLRIKNLYTPSQILDLIRVYLEEAFSLLPEARQLLINSGVERLIITRKMFDYSYPKDILEIIYTIRERLVETGI